MHIDGGDAGLAFFFGIVCIVAVASVYRRIVHSQIFQNRELNEDNKSLTKTINAYRAFTGIEITDDNQSVKVLEVKMKEREHKEPMYRQAAQVWSDDDVPVTAFPWSELDSGIINYD